MPEILRHLGFYSGCAAQVDEVIAEILQPAALPGCGARRPA